MILALGALALSVILFAIIEIQLIGLKNKYATFFRDGSKDSLHRQLTKYSSDVREALHKLDQLASFSAKLHQKNLEAISKTGLIRFNPFGDTGGDQSFCLALLDNNDTGFVISSIHARSGTRFYAKEVIKGKPSHALSDEEQQALEKATSNT